MVGFIEQLDRGPARSWFEEQVAKGVLDSSRLTTLRDMLSGSGYHVHLQYGMLVRARGACGSDHNYLNDALNSGHFDVVFMRPTDLHWREGHEEVFVSAGSGLIVVQRDVQVPKNREGRRVNMGGVERFPQGVAHAFCPHPNSYLELSVAIDPPLCAEHCIIPFHNVLENIPFFAENYHRLWHSFFLKRQLYKPLPVHSSSEI